MPAHGTKPPGTERSKPNAPAPPTISSPSKAACILSISSTREKRSIRSSVSPEPRYWSIGKIARPNSSRSRQGRTSKAIRESLELLERRVVEHQPALRAVVREAHRHDSPGLD